MLTIPLPRRGALVNQVRQLAVEATALAVGGPGDASGPQRHLIRYWTTGVGGKLKIRWGTDGSFARCVSQLGRIPELARYNVKGLCANLRKRATGDWPTEGGKAGIPS